MSGFAFVGLGWFGLTVLAFGLLVVCLCWCVKLCEAFVWGLFVFACVCLGWFALCLLVLVSVVVCLCCVGCVLRVFVWVGLL